MNRLFFCMCAVLFVLGTIYAQEAPTKTTDYAARLQSLENETQTQVSAIEQQIAEADGAAKESLNRQIEQLKKNYEIRRLEVLLEQAESQSDEVRAAEIRKALDYWLNPPVTENTTKVNRPAPDAPGVLPESHETNR